MLQRFISTPMLIGRAVQTVLRIPADMMWSVVSSLIASVWNNVGTDSHTDVTIAQVTFDSLVLAGTVTAWAILAPIIYLVIRGWMGWVLSVTSN